MADPTGFGDDGLRVEDPAVPEGRDALPALSYAAVAATFHATYKSEPDLSSFARAFAQCFPTTYTCTVCGSEHIAKPGDVPTP